MAVLSTSAVVRLAVGTRLAVEQQYKVSGMASRPTILTLSQSQLERKQEYEAPFGGKTIILAGELHQPAPTVKLPRLCLHCGVNDSGVAQRLTWSCSHYFEIIM